MVCIAYTGLLIAKVDADNTERQDGLTHKHNHVKNYSIKLK